MRAHQLLFLWTLSGVTIDLSLASEDLVGIQEFHIFWTDHQSQHIDLFDVTCDLDFVNVWSMAGEGSGIHSFTFLKFSLMLTNIYRHLFDVYRLFGGTEISILFE